DSNDGGSSTPGEDAATDPDLDASASTDGGSTPVADAAVVPPYASCTEDTDCNEGDVCNKFAAAGVCAAACQDEGDCNVPDGEYEATLTCTAEGHCKLDCAPEGAPPLPR